MLFKYFSNGSVLVPHDVDSPTRLIDTTSAQVENSRFIVIPEELFSQSIDDGFRSQEHERDQSVFRHRDIGNWFVEQFLLCFIRFVHLGCRY